ncbi:MAG TPA: hypothetical protein PLN52_03615 [Opitutaceae bacterium]|nr:hypothetical protein [Opitutaceae bacterium]
MPERSTTGSSLLLSRALKTVAKNDNWNSADAAQVDRAASSVGAFSFKRGSRDAAVVATLPPGAYTALVSGKSDTSGVALVEVYEIVD